ncbi:MAG: trimethylamine methyltransferase family protein [Candidatus Jordarchaeum sp.]|uniref:trimethylamine methyltransferase family protein n=1 Tax=Candidatus Jordarchaeum sp. TaxID=2823881 RepID=UPI004049C3F4
MEETTVKRPNLSLLEKESIREIYSAALRILESVGVEINNFEALELLHQNDVIVDFNKKRAKFPQDIVEKCVKSVPSEIKIYSRDGKHDLLLKDNNVHFDPGSAAINILDDGVIRKPVSDDLEKFVRLAHHLEYIHAQSTALVITDVPERFVDRYRLYIVLKNSTKPVITGAFTKDGVHEMKNLLEIVIDRGDIAKKPIAIFDACPTPPLEWSEITSQNLIDCARYRIPVELVSMPLAGATSPATLAGSIVQHTAETLSGIVIAQLVNRGAPCIYGGSPAIFDMRQGTTPMGAIETIMIDCAYAQIGKFLGLPTHAYLGLSDSKTVDSQSGFESALGIFLGALTGINVISGPGMLDFESCQSMEKLVIDNEICGMALRMIQGIQVSNESLAEGLIREIGPGGYFLNSRHTLKWFRKEQFIPSILIDRMTTSSWQNRGSKTTLQRAKEEVKRILAEHEPEALSPDIEKELESMAEKWRFA